MKKIIIALALLTSTAAHAQVYGSGTSPNGDVWSCAGSVCSGAGPSGSWGMNIPHNYHYQPPSYDDDDQD